LKLESTGHLSLHCVRSTAHVRVTTMFRRKLDGPSEREPAQRPSPTLVNGPKSARRQPAPPQLEIGIKSVKSKGRLVAPERDCATPRPSRPSAFYPTHPSRPAFILGRAGHYRSDQIETSSFVWKESMPPSTRGEAAVAEWSCSSCAAGLVPATERRARKKPRAATPPRIR